MSTVCLQLWTSTSCTYYDIIYHCHFCGINTGRLFRGAVFSKNKTLHICAKTLCICTFLFVWSYDYIQKKLWVFLRNYFLNNFPSTEHLLMRKCCERPYYTETWAIKLKVAVETITRNKSSFCVTQNRCVLLEYCLHIISFLRKRNRNCCYRNVKCISDHWNFFCSFEYFNLISCPDISLV